MYYFSVIYYEHILPLIQGFANSSVPEPHTQWLCPHPWQGADQKGLCTGRGRLCGVHWTLGKGDVNL